jgi:hypothetical protein
VGERDRDPAVDHLCPPRRLTIVERQDVALTLKVLAAGAVAGIAANVRISHQRLAVPSLSVLHSDHMAARRVLDALPVRRRASDRCLDWDCTPLQRGLVGAGPWEPRAFDRSGFRLDTLGGNNSYLRAVAVEAEMRGYSFDRRKIGRGRRDIVLSATRGQLAYEWKHLLRKLRTRDPGLYARWRRNLRPAPHPLFEIVAGGVEAWERRRLRRDRRVGSLAAHR